MVIDYNSIKYLRNYIRILKLSDLKKLKVHCICGSKCFI
jgi:hypothetical protein